MKRSTRTSAEGRDGSGGGGDAGVVLSLSVSPLASGSGWIGTVVWIGLSSSSGGLTSGSREGHWPMSAFSKDTGWAKSMGLRTHKELMSVVSFSSFLPPTYNK